MRRGAWIVALLLVACQRPPGELECAGEGSADDAAARASLLGSWSAAIDDPDTPFELELRFDPSTVHVTGQGETQSAPWEGCAGDGFVSVLVRHADRDVAARARVDGDRLQIAPLYDVVFRRISTSGQTP